MRSHFPKGRHLPALDQNILKYRAFEMLLMLFHVEDFKAFVYGSLPKQQKQEFKGKKKYQNTWAFLVTNGIITESDSDEIQRLIDYRNNIAHEIHKLTYDLSREPDVPYFRELNSVKYDYKALKQLKQYREKISRGYQSKGYIFLASLDPLLFEAAEKTYLQELQRLSKKITRQLAVRNEEAQRLNAEVSALNKQLLSEIDPCHPLNIAKNGTLTKRGVECCYQLFDRDVSVLAVAHLMRTSYRAVMKHHRDWENFHK